MSRGLIPLSLGGRGVRGEWGNATKLLRDSTTADNRIRIAARRHLGIVCLMRAIAATGDVLAAEADNRDGEENGERENPAHDGTHPWGAKRN